MPRIPSTVWVLGSVSLCMDLSSEFIHAVLPVYLTAVLGLSVLAVGAIEGFAEATASLLKIVSGAVSDRFARRKPLVLLGYGLSALTKPLFPLAGSAAGVVTARCLDRIGKGIRGAPRDAIIADVTPAPLRDVAYGLRQALDTVGAILGPLLALVCLWFWTEDLRSLLWVATIPAVLAVALLVWGIAEPASAPPAARVPRTWVSARTLSWPVWRVVALGALLSMARVPEAFLVLRAVELGLALTQVPLVVIVMNVVYAASAYPAGALAAATSRDRVLGIAIVVLAAALSSLAFIPGTAGLWLGVGLWGLHMGLSQGAMVSAVAAAALPAARATAFGVFHGVTGVFQLAGGVLAGWLWSRHGSVVAFTAGAMLAVISLIFVLSRRRPS